jgi:hypothetical protein
MITHPAPERPEFWWACDEPERPGDKNTCFFRECKWCVIKAELELSLGRDLGWRGIGGGMGAPFNEFVAHARASLSESPCLTT